jgi:hypothetical protein
VLPCRDDSIHDLGRRQAVDVNDDISQPLVERTAFLVKPAECGERIGRE